MSGASLRARRSRKVSPSNPPLVGLVGGFGGGGGGGVHKFRKKRNSRGQPRTSAKRALIVRNLYPKMRESKISKLQIFVRYPHLLQAVRQIPYEIASPQMNGLYLSRKAFIGLQRAGMDYLLRWFRRHRVKLDVEGMVIARALGFFSEFIPWDSLFEYLAKVENWGDLKGDQGLSSYPQKTIEEEKQQRQEEALKQTQLQKEKESQTEARKQREKLLQEHSTVQSKIRTAKFYITKGAQDQKFNEKNDGLIRKFEEELPAYEQRLNEIELKLRSLSKDPQNQISQDPQFDENRAKWEMQILTGEAQRRFDILNQFKEAANRLNQPFVNAAQRRVVEDTLQSCRKAYLDLGGDAKDLGF